MLANSRIGIFEEGFKCVSKGDLRMSSLSKLILCISKARILRKIIEKSYASRLEGELTPAVVFVERVRIGKSEHRGRTRRGERMTSAFLNKFLFIFFFNFIAHSGDLATVIKVYHYS